MRRLFRGTRFHLASALLTFAYLSTVSARAQFPYSPVEMPAPAGTTSYLNGIDPAGRVVGAAYIDSSTEHAFLWQPNGAGQDLTPAAPAGVSTATDINAKGQIVGRIPVGYNTYHAFLWDAGTLKDLGTLPSGTVSAATAINGGGLIVGYASNTASRFLRHAVVWQDGVIRDIGTFGGEQSYATSVNDAGTVVGYAQVGTGEYHAFSWQNNVMTDLGAQAGGESYAYGVNADGQIVGSASVGWSSHAVAWIAGKMVDLGVLPGDEASAAYAVNDAGQIVGVSWHTVYDSASGAYSEADRAFVYTAGLMEDLNALASAGPGRIFTAAHAINASGQIAAVASGASDTRGVRLDPSATPHLAFIQSPAAGLAGVPLSPHVVVQVRASNGAVNDGFNGPVSVAIKAGSGAAGAILKGAAVVTAVHGVASFGGLSVDRAGIGYVLTASTASLASSDSAPFPVGFQHVYVRPGGSDANSGSSWNQAFGAIQAAVESPLRLPETEIWVAGGTYLEAIRASSSVQLFGGFSGAETERSQRNIPANPTIVEAGLSGAAFDLSADATSGNAAVDGFTIRNSLYGVQYTYGNVTIRNSTFLGNARALHGSGGIALIEANAVTGSTQSAISVTGPAIVRNNAVYGNGSVDAGGIAVGAGAQVLGNSVHNNSGAYTGGISCTGTAVIANNLVYANAAVSANTGSDSIRLIGGILCGGGSPTVANNTIVANAGQDAGGIGVVGSSPTVVNNIIAYNSSSLFTMNGAPALRNNCLYGNAASAVSDSAIAGANGNIGAEPRFAAMGQGNFHIQAASPCRDAGYSAAVSAGDLDMDGQPRLQGPAVDMGADESDGTPYVLPRVVVRVSPTGDDAGDGASWTSAKRSLNAAVAAAVGGEVWVAAGTYSGAVSLPSFTEIYGGFAGTETNRDDRDPVAHISVIDASAAGDAVTVPPGTTMARVDGLTLRNAVSRGNPAVGGCGVNAGSLASVTVARCTIVGNALSGVKCGGVSVVSGCRISGNGGGIDLRDNATATGNVVEGNAGVGIWAGGAAVVVENVVRSNGAHGLAGDGCAVFVRNIVSRNAGDGFSVTCGTAVLRGNVSMGNAGAGVNLGSAYRADLFGNTVAGNATGGVVSAYLDPSKAAPVTAVNNIVAFNGGTGFRLYGSFECRSNCVFGNAISNYADIDLTGARGNISVDPLLGNVPAANAHIRPESPCRDAGDALAALSGETDIDGQSRIQGAGPDIGADESDGSIPALAPIVRVSPTGSDANDGSAWDRAKRSVQAAIEAVKAGGGDVWVAAGVYHERISLAAWVRVLGGFSGVEAYASGRQPQANVSVLDGQGAGTVVTLANGNWYTLLDGCTVRNGAGTMGTLSGTPAALRGSGVLCLSDGTISNNVITGNTADYGAGVELESGAAVQNNVITGNTATTRGGGVNTQSAGRVTGNTIAHNHAPSGGGVCVSAEIPALDRNTIAWNTAAQGAGVYTDGSGRNPFGVGTYGPSWTANVVANNTATGNGGGVYATYPPNLIHWTIAGNAAADGGAVHGAQVGLSNCIVAFNSPGLFSPAAGMVITGSDVYGNARYDVQNTPDPRGAAGNLSVNPMFASTDGDYHLTAGSPAINAAADLGGGGLTLDRDGLPRVFGPHADMGAYEFRYSPGIGDVTRALRLAGGLDAATGEDTARLNGADASRSVDVVDAVGLLRRALQINPAR
ncbi:MAG TPA: choice-of-anchor Q domain-containing protein [Armatimonadota bacterium]